MKLWVHSDIKASQDADSTFDERWNNKFGEPSTDVFTVEEFDQFMQEVINFE